MAQDCMCRANIPAVWHNMKAPESSSRDQIHPSSSLLYYQTSLFIYTNSRRPNKDECSKGEKENTQQAHSQTGE